MRLYLVFALLGSAQLVRCFESRDLTQRQITLSHNRELMDYMLRNSEDIFETIVRGGPGSTELLSQVAGVALTTQTQAWFRCSKRYNVKREVFAENIGNYRAYTNQNELCAKSCFLEETRMVSNGKLDPAMMTLVMIMAYGDDRDIHKFTKELVHHCNAQVPSTTEQSCKSAEYLECYVKGLKKANVYIPGQIIHEYRNPWVLELTS